MPARCSFRTSAACRAPVSGPTESFAVLPGLRQAGSRSLSQNLTFELSENRKQASHSTTGWCGQIQGFGQGDETNTKMIQLLKCGQQIGSSIGPTIQAPHQHHIDLTPTGRLQQFLAGFPPHCPGVHLAYLQRDHPTTAAGVSCRLAESSRNLNPRTEFQPNTSGRPQPRRNGSGRGPDLASVRWSMALGLSCWQVVSPFA
jgi:hypothetical protein